MTNNLLKIFILCFLLIILETFAFNESLLIASINLDKVINEVDDGIKARAMLKKELKVKQKLFNKKSKQAKVLRNELYKKKLLMKEQMKYKKFQKLQQISGEMQQMYASIHQFMLEQQQKITQHIIQRIEPIINKFIKARGYAYILNGIERNILYVQPNCDLTNEVIRKYNKFYKEINKIDYSKKHF